jgi:hypothetical protein
MTTTPMNAGPLEEAIGSIAAHDRSLGLRVRLRRLFGRARFRVACLRGAGDIEPGKWKNTGIWINAALASGRVG